MDIYEVNRSQRHLLIDGFRPPIAVTLIDYCTFIYPNTFEKLMGRTNREGALLHYSCRKGSYYSEGVLLEEGALTEVVRYLMLVVERTKSGLDKFSSIFHQQNNNDWKFIISLTSSTQISFS